MGASIKTQLRTFQLEIPVTSIEKRGAMLLGHAMVYDARHDVCVLLLPRNFSGPLQTYLFRFGPMSASFKNVRGGE